MPAFDAQIFPKGQARVPDSQGLTPALAPHPFYMINIYMIHYLDHAWLPSYEVLPS